MLYKPVRTKKIRRPLAQSKLHGLLHCMDSLKKRRISPDGTPEAVLGVRMALYVGDWQCIFTRLQ